ncbi:MAG: hypothetical protein V4463_11830 [Pseudomonadota bacterium]
MCRPVLPRLLVVLFVLSLAACASLLPDEQKQAKTPWKNYAEAQAAFARIEPGKTTLAQLGELGFSPERTPNVAVLSHADLLRHLHAMIDFEGKGLEPALKLCVSAREACYAYRIEQQALDRERVGNFFSDFFNFRRTTNVSGWKFDALILVSNGVVSYKSWSGKPNIQEVEHEHHPLGPLQGLGSSVR